MQLYILGDSNTYGYLSANQRLEKGKRWPDRLAHLRPDLELSVQAMCGRLLDGNPLNISGSLNGSEVLSTYLSHHQPDGLVLALGINDLLQGTHPSKLAHSLDQLLTTTRVLVPSIWFIAPHGLPPKGNIDHGLPNLQILSHQLMRNVKPILTRHQAHLIFAHHCELCDDGIHLTDKGHHQLAEHMAKVLY